MRQRGGEEKIGKYLTSMKNLNVSREAFEGKIEAPSKLRPSQKFVIPIF